MRIADAPPPGWYPDPEGGSRLRYWEGTDWADRYRMKPLDAHLSAVIAAAQERTGGDHRWVPTDPGLLNPRVDTQAVVDQVRVAARQEAERAAQMFGSQARTAAQNFQPLITEYTTKISRFFRRLMIVVIVFAIAWFTFQALAQKSMFEWIGDRIDNVTDEINDESSHLPPAARSLRR
jgi:hypothetical protein